MRKRIRVNSNLKQDKLNKKNSNNKISYNTTKKSREKKKKDKNILYRINSKGEKRRIIFSIPLVSLVCFVIIIYLLSVEIYSNYNVVDMNDVIVNFNVQLSKGIVEDLDNHVVNTILWDFSDACDSEDFNDDGNEPIENPTYIDSELTKLRVDDDLFVNSVKDVGVESKVLSQNSYVTASGEKYHIIANLNIPSLGINYPVLSSTSNDLLKISLTKYWGADPNEKGNMVVLGHNYESKKFFSKLPKIKVGDKIEITDLSSKTLTYTVYDTQIINPYDNSCTSQLTNGYTEVTLITCYNRDANRFVVKARAD